MAVNLSDAVEEMFGSLKKPESQIMTELFFTMGRWGELQVARRRRPVARARRRGLSDRARRRPDDAVQRQNGRVANAVQHQRMPDAGSELHSDRQTVFEQPHVLDPVHTGQRAYGLDARLRRIAIRREVFFPRGRRRRRYSAVRVDVGLRHRPHRQHGKSRREQRVGAGRGLNEQGNRSGRVL